MKIFVCVKQVPATSKVQLDSQTGALKRDGVAAKMNPYDLFALEIALQLRERHGGSVSVGTMGPPQAQDVIREAYMMGADEGYVFSDRCLGGADVLATSYTLSQAIRSVGNFELILCGKQTTDGDTAQVGPAIAEHMAIPHAACVTRVDVDGDGVLAEQQFQDSLETVRIPFPCLLTVEQDICMPRLPSLFKAREVSNKPITILGLDNFPDRDPSHYGLSGSPTRVERIFPPQGGAQRETWTDGDLAARIYDALVKWRFISNADVSAGK